VKVGDLVRVTTECFDEYLIGEVGIVTHVFDHFNDGRWLEVYVLFSDGHFKIDTDDIEVISESG